MQVKIIGAIYGLTLIPDDTRIVYQNYLLTQGDEVLSQNFSLTFSTLLGVNNFNCLRSQPYFFLTEDRKEDEDFFELSNKALAITQELIAFLWFVKDNSCNLHQLFTYTPHRENVIFMDKTTNYSNSHGDFSDIQFSCDEILKATKIMIAAKELSSSNKHVKSEGFYKVNKINGITKTSLGQIQYALRNRVERAILFLLTARQSSFIPMKIALYMNVLECLFSDTSSGDIVHKISERAAFYVGQCYCERMKIFKTIKDAYTLRSKYFHGQKLDHKAYSNSMLCSMAMDVDNLIRNVLVKVITIDAEKFTASDENIGKWFNKLVFDRN